jgi:glutamate/aspartate transport system substrate-binding protein
VIRRLAALAALGLVPALAAPAEAPPDTLRKIRETRTVTIAYRTDAQPFSFEDAKQPAGYTVELCKRVVASLEQQLGLERIAVRWVAATAQNRLELVRSGQADLECGATTATFSRMELVDFSSPVFVDTTGVLARRAPGAKTIGGLQGKKIAVIEGTTNRKALEKALAASRVSATVVPVMSREEGVAALEAGRADAFAGDRVLLLGLGAKVKDPSRYDLLDEDLGIEPYAIVLPRGDAAFRLAVNRGLAQIFSSTAITEIFGRSFGPSAKPSRALQLVFALGTYAE